MATTPWAGTGGAPAAANYTWGGDPTARRRVKTDAHREGDDPYAGKGFYKARDDATGDWLWVQAGEMKPLDTTGMQMTPTSSYGQSVPTQSVVAQNPSAQGGMLSQQAPQVTAASQQPNSTGALSQWYDDYIRSPGNPSAYTPERAATTQWNVDPTQTVQGQVAQISASGSPLMQRAATQGLQQANRRGLLNSSMAVGAAQNAVLDQAVPIATQDANIYARSGEFNANAANQAAIQNASFANDAARFGAGAANDLQRDRYRTAADLALEGSRQRFQSGENQAEREFRTGERVGEQSWRTGERTAAEQHSDRQLVAQSEARLRELGFAAQLDDQRIPRQRVAELATQTMSAVNAIMADPNLTPEAKTNAATNVINNANATIRWAGAVYGQAFPEIAGFQSPSPAPGQAPTAQQQANVAAGLPADFNPQAYLANNPDVAQAIARGEFGGDPANHWREYGHRENRKYS